MIPLSLRIKKESHRKIAQAQDLIIEEVYKKFDRAVLHGGTAIWRCFNGKRFSEDLDFYFPKDEKKINELFSLL
jgi:predicted nucleotidyltransferase component of viral defense system